MAASCDLQGDESPLLVAKKAVDDLYAYRDYYFENNGVEKAPQKTSDVKMKLQASLGVLDSLAEKIDSKAQLLMLKGKTLNVLPSYDASAQEALAKAVKLDPKLVEAWNHLGECYWKNSAIEAAKNCFVGALQHERNKVSLRNLSMVLRQFGSDAAERKKYIEESLEKAKEAVQMDVKDGTSWFILGNAYFSLFFAGAQHPAHLRQCMSAYAQADKDKIAAHSPDLHYNRAVAQQYQGELQEALKGYDRAAALDPSWPDPVQKRDSLLDHIIKVRELVETKGQLSGRHKLQKLVDKLKRDEEAELGPYQGGSYTSPSGQTVRLVSTPVGQLKPGGNGEAVLLATVVANVTSSEPVPFVCVLVDREQAACALSVYNIAPTYGFKIGDTVAIPEPFVQSTVVRHAGQEIAYMNIRVETPVVLVVNGKKLGVDKQALSVLSVRAKSE